MALSSKLAKVSEAFTVYMYDNGYMIEVSGQDNDENWKTVKLVCNTIQEVVKLVEEINNMPKDR